MLFFMRIAKRTAQNIAKMLQFGNIYAMFCVVFFLSRLVSGLGFMTCCKLEVEIKLLAELGTCDISQL